jgi:hypothetical protein
MKTVYKYDEVYVVFRYGDTEFYDVYTVRDEAVLKCDEQNQSMSKLIFQDPKSPKFEVITLWDALDKIKDALRDQMEFDSWNEQS